MNAFGHRFCTLFVLSVCFFFLCGVNACGICNHLNIIDTWNSGTVELIFAGDGTYQGCSHTGCDTNGFYAISGNEIRLTDNQCGFSAEGVYEISFNEDNDELTFVRVSDPCEQRASVIPGTWNRAALIYPTRE